MPDEYLGHRLCNLIVPEEPEVFVLPTPSGEWEFARDGNYAESKRAIQEGKCAGTYAISRSVDVSHGRAAALDVAFEELLPICLGASFLTGLTVRPFQDLMHSAVQFLQIGSHFPRERSMGQGWAMAATLVDFVADLEIFVREYPALEQSEKARLLIHHWLDALAYWSLEDLTLSATTMLEIIAATAERVAAAAGTPRTTFVTRINYAADRFGLQHLPAEFRMMRNDLVHEGHLSGTRFPNKTEIECAQAAAGALDWIDRYICAIFGLGTPRSIRFGMNAFVGINAFSLN
jgi:hypothetical protein